MYINVMRPLRVVGAMSFAVAAWLTIGGTVQPARATVILEGSDAIGYHCQGGEPGACVYRDEAWSAIGGSSPLPIAVVGTPTVGTIGSGTHPVVDFATLDSAGVGALSQYSAIYFVAGNGCCQSAPGDMGTRLADVLAYLAAGGTVMIENYDGNAAWDPLFGGTGSYSSSVAGFGGLAPTGTICSDNETVTAAGLANGFTQPPVINCWTHQGYLESTFAPLGFTLSFFDAPPDMTLAATGWSSLLSNGLTNTGSTVPEPASFALLAAGLVGLGLLRRRRG